MSRGRRIKRGVLIVAASLVAILVVAGIANRPPPLDLRTLASLNPLRKVEEPGCCTTYYFRQPLEQVETVLDRVMNPSTNWEPGGARKFDYIWYHRQGWRSPLQGLFASAGLGGTFVTLEPEKSGSKVTVFPGPGGLSLP